MTIFRKTHRTRASASRKAGPDQREEVRSGDWLIILLNALPLLLLVGFCLFLMRQMQAGGTALSWKIPGSAAFGASREGDAWDVAGTMKPRKSCRKLLSS
jgi:ATP-dependent Zn protease